MQRFEKKKKNPARIEPKRQTWQTRPLTTSPQIRRCRYILKVPFLVELMRKKEIGGKYMGTLC